MKYGGNIIAYVPNGSIEFLLSNRLSFHKLCGRVHPVMLDEIFVRRALVSAAVAVGAHADEELDGLKNWE